jgi:isocitrate/isopropylmalate dehydrogenase
MPGSRKTRGRKHSGRRAASKGKVRKRFWLDPATLADAQAFLGTATERDTVEVALELVAFRRELACFANLAPRESRATSRSRTTRVVRASN